ncbi:MAG: zf-HC2 domain-containing protein, partial [Myxococcota bacterium]|nr:zf-HC2 domain-containing protein [Myxococcota bacterium]
MSDVDPRCAPFEEDLSALLDGELEAVRAEVVREHAAACAACGRRVAALRAVDATLLRAASSPLRGEDARIAALRARLADRGRTAAIGQTRPAPP